MMTKNEIALTLLVIGRQLHNPLHTKKSGLYIEYWLRNMCPFAEQLMFGDKFIITKLAGSHSMRPVRIGIANCGNYAKACQMPSRERASRIAFSSAFQASPVSQPGSLTVLVL